MSHVTHMNESCRRVTHVAGNGLRAMFNREDRRGNREVSSITILSANHQLFPQNMQDTFRRIRKPLSAKYVGLFSRYAGSSRKWWATTRSPLSWLYIITLSAKCWLFPQNTQRIFRRICRSLSAKYVGLFSRYADLDMQDMHTCMALFKICTHVWLFSKYA